MLLNIDRVSVKKFFFFYIFPLNGNHDWNEDEVSKRGLCRDSRGGGVITHKILGGKIPPNNPPYLRLWTDLPGLIEPRGPVDCIIYSESTDSLHLTQVTILRKIRGNSQESFLGIRGNSQESFTGKSSENLDSFSQEFLVTNSK